MGLKDKVNELYNNQYFQKVRTKKIIKMLKLIVIDKELDLGKISNVSGITEEVIKKYINDAELMKTFFNDQEYQDLKSMFEIIIKNNEDSGNKKEFELISNLIDDVMNSRYKLEDICSKNYTTRSGFNKLLLDQEYLKNNFGEDIIDRLKSRIMETSIIRQKVPKGKFLVEDKNIIFLLKKDIYYLNEYEFRKIKIASDYLNNEADISYMQKGSNIDYQTLISSLSDISLKNIMNEEKYKKLNRLLSYEKLLNEEVATKKQLIKLVVEELINNDYDLNNTINDLNLPYGMIKRIVVQNMLYILYPSEITDNIELMLDKKEKSEHSVKR